MNRRILIFGAALLAGSLLACSKGGEIVPEKPMLPQYCVLVAREGRALEEPPMPSCGFTVTTKYSPIAFRRAANIAFAQNIWGSHQTGERERYIALHIYGEEAYQEFTFYMSRIYHFLETPLDPRNEQVRFLDQALQAWHAGTYGEGGPDPAKLKESQELFDRLAGYEGVAPHFKRWALLWAAWLLVEHSDTPEEGVRRYEMLAQSAETRASAPALSHLSRYYFRKGDRANGERCAREIVSRFARDPRWAQLRYRTQLALAPKPPLPPGVRIETRPAADAGDGEN